MRPTSEVFADKTDWLFGDKPQESVLMWARQNEADVLQFDQ